MFDTGPVRRARPPTTTRWIAVAAGVVAVAALAAGLFGRAVLIDRDTDMTMGCGLRACEACHDTACITTSTLDLASDVATGGGRATPAWGWAGTIAWWAALVGAIGAVLAIAMVAAGKYVRIPGISPTTIALLGATVGLVAGCVFVATKPESIAATQVGWTFWAFGVGTVGAIVSAFLLSRQLAAIEPEFDPGDAPEEPPDEPWQEP